jgi:hypothetical protein
MPKARLLALIALIVLSSGVCLADVVVLKNGSRIEGQVSEEGDSVIVKMPTGTITIPKDQVANIQSKQTPMEIYKENAAKVAANDAEGHYRLALWCGANGLDGDCRAEMEKVLKISPDHEGARKALGYAKQDGKWVTAENRRRIAQEKFESEMLAKGFVKHEGRWVTQAEKDVLDKGLVCLDGKWMDPEEALAACAEFNAADREKDSDLDRALWENAFEHKTLRYRVRCNVSRELTDELSAHIQESFTVYEKTIPVAPPEAVEMPTMPVNVYADEAMFREITGQPYAAGLYNGKFIESYFKGPDAPYAKEALLSVLDHEACHYYLDMAFRNRIPRWLNEGCTQYFSIGRIADEGMRKRLLNALSGPARTAAAAGSLPYGIEEVFAFDEKGYSYGTGETEEEMAADRLMHYAESLLLCSFLIREGDDPRSAYSGVFMVLCEAIKAGKTMQEAVELGFDGVEMDKFEWDWKLYISDTPTGDFVPRLEK